MHCFSREFKSFEIKITNYLQQGLNEAHLTQVNKKFMEFLDFVDIWKQGFKTKGELLVNNNGRILSRRLKKTWFEREKMYKAKHEVRRLKRAVNINQHIEKYILSPTKS